MKANDISLAHNLLGQLQKIRGFKKKGPVDNEAETVSITFRKGSASRTVSLTSSTAVGITSALVDQIEIETVRKLKELGVELDSNL